MTTTFAIVLTVLMFVGFIAFALAMLGVALRYGPRRGSWNQPAAMLRRPGRMVAVMLYAFAVAHVILGIVLATAFEGGGVAIVVTMTITGAFYVMCAHCWPIAHAIAGRWRPGQRDPAT